MAALTDKVAIVTGSASGIGEATAELLAERGAAVVVADINEAGGEVVAARIRARGFQAVAVRTDLNDEGDIERMVASAATEFGGVDVLHNNAALTNPDVLGRDGAISETDGPLFESVLRVNVVGSLLAAKHAVPQMLARGGGVIINMSSAAGIQGWPDHPMYGISKAALVGLTRDVAAQYGHLGIRCVGIAPGTIMTPGLEGAVPAKIRAMHARHALSPRMGTPADVAFLVAFLASDEAGFINGVTIPIDGGLTTHSPTLADQREAEG